MTNENILLEIFEIKEIQSLFIICQKIYKEPILYTVENLSSFIYHNDRDFYDCCKALIICKKLSEGNKLKVIDENICIKSIKFILGHLYLTKSYIFQLYESQLVQSDRVFFEELDVVKVIHLIDEIEQKREIKEGSIFSNCTNF